MTKLKEFDDLKLKITWTLIDIGFQGSDVFKGELITEDIIEYACSFLYETVVAPDILELATTNKEDEERINRIIKALADKERDVNRNIEIRKWTVIYVKKHLGLKQNNCVNGLSVLNDIWLKIGVAENCPHIFQGVGNDILPEDYYTNGNYSKLYDAHLTWLEKEINFLKN